jgi:two-component system cell cycle response regulator
LDELHTELCVLQSHLESLIVRVRQNDINLHRFQTLEMDLLSLSSLRELVERSLQDTRAVFDLEQVSLVLVDEKQELRQFLQEDGLHVDKVDGLVLLPEAAPLERVLGRTTRPYLGALSKERCDLLFLKRPFPAASVALLPLCRRGKLLGSLNLASADPERFCEQMATDFLDRLTRVLSVCLENTLNFELLRRTSLIDMLTGVNNRRFFDQRIGEEIGRVMRSGECLACLFLDVDHFKAINDTYGHQTGDQVLIEVAQRIRSMLRNNDVLARYGGEEFVALLVVGSERKAIEVAERIRHNVADCQLSARDGASITVRLSIGVATLDPASVGADVPICPDRLIEQADRALYDAKKGGRDRVVSAGLIDMGAKKRQRVGTH